MQDLTHLEARAWAAEVAESFPSYDIAVFRDGKTVWSASFGAPTEVQAERDTLRRPLFRLYSVSKVLTAAAAHELAREGRLDPNGPVLTYVPNLPTSLGSIPVRTLIDHTSGIRHYRGDEGSEEIHCADLATAISRFARDPLGSDPGTRTTYSTYGYVLLSAVLEGAASAPFGGIVERYVLEPAGAGDTGLDGRATREVVRPFRRGWISDWEVMPAPDLSCKAGGGAFVSSAEDLARLGGWLLSRLPTADEDFLAPAGGRANASFRGAWSVGRTDGGTPFLWSSGRGVGGTAYLAVFPASGTSVAFLANASGERPTLTVNRLAALFERPPPHEAFSTWTGESLSIERVWIEGDSLVGELSILTGLGAASGWGAPDSPPERYRYVIEPARGPPEALELMPESGPRVALLPPRLSLRFDSAGAEARIGEPGASRVVGRDQRRGVRPVLRTSMVLLERTRVTAEGRGDARDSVPLIPVSTGTPLWGRWRTGSSDSSTFTTGSVVGSFLLDRDGRIVSGRVASGGDTLSVRRIR